MMTEPAFSPEMEKALDAYAVPPVPTGFGDRLMARIASGDTGQVSATTTELPTRRRSASPWRRTSRIIGSVALFSLATATAAAAGVFGDPVYLPGISEALIEAKVVDAPEPKTKPKPVIVAQKPAIKETASTTAEAPKGSAAVVSRLGEMRDDPRYANLTPRQKFAVAGREVRNMVRSGEVTREEARTAVRQLAEHADPETKAAVRAALAERRQQRLERRERLRDATPEERAAFRQALRDRREELQQPAPAEPETSDPETPLDP
jgi:polyhydroxyalkanoate synthesis regulator phasin